VPAPQHPREVSGNLTLLEARNSCAGRNPQHAPTPAAGDQNGKENECTSRAKGDDSAKNPRCPNVEVAAPRSHTRAPRRSKSSRKRGSGRPPAAARPQTGAYRSPESGNPMRHVEEPPARPPRGRGKRTGALRADVRARCNTRKERGACACREVSGSTTHGLNVASCRSSKPARATLTGPRRRGDRGRRGVSSARGDRWAQGGGGGRGPTRRPAVQSNTRRRAGSAEMSSVMGNATPGKIQDHSEPDGLPAPRRGAERTGVGPGGSESPMTHSAAMRGHRRGNAHRWPVGGTGWATKPSQPGEAPRARRLNASKAGKAGPDSSGATRAEEQQRGGQRARTSTQKPAAPVEVVQMFQEETVKAGLGTSRNCGAAARLARGASAIAGWAAAAVAPPRQSGPEPAREVGEPTAAGHGVQGTAPGTAAEQRMPNDGKKRNGRTPPKTKPPQTVAAIGGERQPAAPGQSQGCRTARFTWNERPAAPQSPGKNNAQPTRPREEQATRVKCGTQMRQRATTPSRTARARSIPGQKTESTPAQATGGDPGDQPAQGVCAPSSPWGEGSAFMWPNAQRQEKAKRPG